MSNGDEFTTAVRGVAGMWPPPPAVWSYSSLRDAEECPRRWMLSRATYPSIWGRAGYPPRPMLPAVVGDAVHRVLELILRGLHDRGCQSLADPCAVEVLKELGGYSKLIEGVIDEQLRDLKDNPRIASPISGLRSALRMRVPDIRHRVQGVITRTTLKPIASADRAVLDTPQRRPLGDGSYPEVELRVPELRFGGRADLLTIDDGACTITDYKTGVPNAHHAEQVRTYALLWSRDGELNPNKLPVQQLVLAYGTHDERLDPPTEADLAALAEQLVNGTAEAESQLLLRPPPARPAPAMCRLCGVRQLCEDYWDALKHTATPLSGDETDWFDYEGTVTSKNGPRSWLVMADKGSTLLLRTSSETTTFRPGDKIRLLNLLRGRDPDSPVPIGTLTQASEVFLLEAPS
jgi:hypothetical protein